MADYDDCECGHPAYSHNPDPRDRGCAYTDLGQCVCTQLKVVPE